MTDKLERLLRRPCDDIQSIRLEPNPWRASRQFPDLVANILLSGLSIQPKSDADEHLLAAARLTEAELAMVRSKIDELEKRLQALRGEEQRLWHNAADITRIINRNA